MLRNPKSLIIAASILLSILSGCQALSAVKAPTPIFPPPNQIEAEVTMTSLPSLTPEILPTPIPPTITLPPTEIPATLITESLPLEMRTPIPDNLTLAEEIDRIIIGAGGRWHIVIKEVGGETYYTHSPEQRIIIASTIKIPLALLLFKALEERAVPEIQLIEHLQTTGTGGRTFDQLLYAMLVKSEEDATEIIQAYIDDFVNVPAQMAAWELQDIDLVSRRYTASGIASLLERFYQGEFVSPTARRQILHYLSEYTPSDEARIGILSDLIPEDFQIYNKRGSLTTPYVVADSAILENPLGKDYIIVVFAYQGEPKTTYEILDQAIGEIALVFWNHISTPPNP